MIKSPSKIISLLLLLSILLSPVVTAAPVEAMPAPDEGVVSEEDLAWLAMAESATSFTVQLQAPSLVMHLSEQPGLILQAEPAAIKAQLASPQARDYLAELNYGIDAFIYEAESLLGRQLVVSHRYDHVINGFSAQMNVAEAAILRKHPAVREVFVNSVLYPDSDTSHTFIGADEVWSGNAVPFGVGNMGEGTRVGMIDTGINVSHPSFSDVTPGYTYPSPPEGYLGLCATNPTGYKCNNKLIGIYDMIYNVNGWDQNNHGSHVAGIVAGNPIDVVFQDAHVTITGIAPRAQIISYKVCNTSGCESEDVTEAIDQAVADQVDVIALAQSWQSGPAQNPWQGPIELALLEATASGIVTTASAGNAGNPESIYRAAPWTLVTGSTTHGRIFGYSIWADGVGLTTEFIGYPASTKLAPALVGDLDQIRLVKPADTDLEGCLPWDTTSQVISNRIGLVKRGVCDFIVKLQNFQAAGGAFLLVYNDKPGVPPIEMGSDTVAAGIPAAMISYESGIRLWNAPGTVKLTIPVQLTSGTEPTWGDILAQSSSRGPVSNLDVLKPDLVAPGLNILSAYAAPNANGLMSGTSQAYAQVAGAAAVMRSLYPNWSPTAIQSALTMTALAGTTRDFDGSKVYPFDYGNGRLDLSKAALTGLVMEETAQNFFYANPDRGGDPRRLNIPSYQNSVCMGSCSFTRTLRNVSGVATTYSIGVDKLSSAIQVTTSPAGSFTIPAGGIQQVTVTIQPAVLAGDPWQFARVVLKTDNTFPNDKKISDVGFSLAVKTKMTGSNLPSAVRALTHLAANQLVLQGTQFTGSISKFNTTRYGFTPATTHSFELAEDPTRSLPYDDLDQVWWTTLTCPSNQQRMVVEVLDTEANDLDVFIGIGAIPQESNVKVRSEVTGSLEYISITNPTFSGDCWILVQNWASSGSGVSDPVELAIAFVPKNIQGTFTASAPATVAPLAPFNIKIDYVLGGFDAPDAKAWYGHLRVGSASGNPDDIGAVDINLYKTTLTQNIFLFLPITMK